MWQEHLSLVLSSAPAFVRRARLIAATTISRSGRMPELTLAEVRNPERAGAPVVLSAKLADPTLPLTPPPFPDFSDELFAWLKTSDGEAWARSPGGWNYTLALFDDITRFMESMVADQKGA